MKTLKEIKVDIFYKGKKKLMKFPIKKTGRFCQIVMAFSENMNLKSQ